MNFADAINAEKIKSEFSWIGPLVVREKNEENQIQPDSISNKIQLLKIALTFHRTK